MEGSGPEDPLLRRIARLETRVGEQDVVIATQRERIAELERELASARKSSATSSKPPSSDIVKPKRKNPADPQQRRKKGAQPGHAKHDRKPFAAEDVDKIHEHTLDACPDCGQGVSPGTEAPRIIQQIEINEKPFRVDEHRAPAYWCPGCKKIHYARMPTEVETGQLAGPRLTALVAYLKGACHASFSTIRKYLRDVVGVRISRGYLAKVVQKVSAALDEAYAEAESALRSLAAVNVDETGHKENGKRYWTWCFRAESFAFFKISGSRGSDVLFDMLGKDFEGVIGCDYFSAYRKYMRETNALVQFCLAHLIRDLKFLTTLKGRGVAAYGTRVLDALKELFNLVHNRHALSEQAFKNALTRKREEILKVGTERVPGAQEAQNLANRFRKHGKAYFEFITTPGIEPTNNLAEQAIRFVVIDRLVTQGTRSEKGREWCERIWTVMATCAQQGRSAFEFLVATTAAHFRGEPTPSLLPAPS